MDKQVIIKNIREFAESLLIALVLAFFIRTFIVQAFKIPSGSMRPTLIEGDRLLVWKLPYWFGKNPERGDVIVFKYPEDLRKDFIKRLIGKGGETLEINRGSILVNGQPVIEPRLINRYYYNRGEYGAEGQKILVPEKHFYVLGDNSANSRDSRYWGVVPRKNLVGRAFVVYWPLNRIRIIK
ncbi:MAG: signal peptidase I [Candidatus Omnitrophota bacterium]